MRSRALSRVALLAAFSVGAPTVLAAQAPAGDSAMDTVCDRKASFDTCINRLMDEAATAAREVEEARIRGIEAVPEKVEEQATPATDPGSSTSVLDLLSPLAGALGFDGVSDPSGNFTFDRVLRLGGAARLRLGGTVFGDAELFEALQEKLEAADPDGTVSGLDSDVGDFDKVDFQATLSREGSIAGRYYGRAPETYKPFLSHWQKKNVVTRQPPFAAWQERQSPILEAALDDYERATAGDRDAPSFFKVPIADLEAPVGPVPADVLGQLDRSLRDLEQEHLAYIRAVDLRGAIELLDELIANQPQAMIEGTYEERRHLTGPDEWAVAASYEIGLSGNVNDFVSWAEDNQGGDCTVTDGIPSHACLDDYLASDGPAFQRRTEKVKATNGPRLKLSLQYAKTSPLHVALTEPAFQFDLDRSEAWTGSLTYGRYLSTIGLPHLPGLLDQQGVDGQLARFDLEARYDDVTGDPMRQSRFVATATLSQKTSDDSALSLSVVWAEKPEYLGEVDEKVSANLGLKWQLDPGGE